MVHFVAPLVICFRIVGDEVDGTGDLHLIGSGDLI